MEHQQKCNDTFPKKIQKIWTKKTGQVCANIFLKKKGDFYSPRGAASDGKQEKEAKDQSIKGKSKATF